MPTINKKHFLSTATIIIALIKPSFSASPPESIIEIFNKNPKIKQQIVNELQKQHVTFSNSVLTGQEAPLITEARTGTRHGAICEEHNCRHTLSLYILSDDQNAYGSYIEDNGAFHLFGDIPSPDIITTIRNYFILDREPKETNSNNPQTSCSIFPANRNKDLFSSYKMCEHKSRFIYLIPESTTTVVEYFTNDAKPSSISYSFDIEEPQFKTIVNKFTKAFGRPISIKETPQLPKSDITGLAWKQRSVLVKLFHQIGESANGLFINRALIFIDSTEKPTPW